MFPISPAYDFALEINLGDGVSRRDFQPPLNQLKNRWSQSTVSSSSASRNSTTPPGTPASEISRGKRRSTEGQGHLPDNGALAPVLRPIENSSKWDVLLRGVSFGLNCLLWDADFQRPQFGIFEVGEKREEDRCSQPVLGVLLGPGDVGKWEKVEEGVRRLCQMYARNGEVPPIRYWAKRPLAVEELASSVSPRPSRLVELPKRSSLIKPEGERKGGKTVHF
jgi:hypothetical protein